MLLQPVLPSCVAFFRRRPASTLPLAKQVELRGGKGEVDGEGDVVAEFGWGGVGAEFDASDLGGPCWWKKTWSMQWRLTVHY